MVCVEYQKNTLYAVLRRFSGGLRYQVSRLEITFRIIAIMDVLRESRQAAPNRKKSKPSPKSCQHSLANHPHPSLISLNLLWWNSYSCLPMLESMRIMYISFHAISVSPWLQRRNCYHFHVSSTLTNVGVSPTLLTNRPALQKGQSQAYSAMV